jgi:hypothetical protein
MERIGEALNTTQKTISKDLENYTKGINQPHAKSAANPKGAGRPTAILMLVEAPPRALPSRVGSPPMRPS